MPSNHVNQSKPKHNTIEGRAFWLKQFKLFNNSTLSRKAFCREHDLNYDRFQFWYIKVHDEKGQNNSTRLIPVQEQGTEIQGAALCSIELSNGHRLLIHAPQMLDYILERLS